jgi:hypothetical protein
LRHLPAPRTTRNTPPCLRVHGTKRRRSAQARASATMMMMRAAASDVAAPVCGPDAADARALLSVRADAPDGAAAALACLAAHGGVIWEGAVPEAALCAAAEALAPFLEDVRARWDAHADALPISWRRWGVTRCPRVGRGKKNVHFDPHGASARMPNAHAFGGSLCATDTSLLSLSLSHARAAPGAQAARCTTRWRRWRLPAASRRC